ncbi:hypothetical protein FPOAC2_05880 [Fusarium poae]|jgi:hypothetical protein|uniref:Uncharacterized protein n=1 Tax=Fusarium poae TaxID=36050 RepID=A0A1B8AVZ8_FUSPO|nr:hypothetical protein FPOAC1_005762 [Fusarium poae]KAG8672487.1 hypothetical protein FPOAC1_005762 [Fusarium poae]OBS24690.1 hypothetical protein FPOA_05230 [Fusarium poae]
MDYLQNSTNPNICLSGGADGADMEWGNCAASVGHQVIHWSFPGHSSQATQDQLIRLTDEELKIGNAAIENAARALGKSPPRRPTVSRLLHRNYYQVAWSEACYAVTFVPEAGGHAHPPGGTAWATTMFSQLHPDNHSLYVFDQIKNVWLQWQGESWVVIESPPRPAGIWAGIGARALQQNGKDAIRKLMGCTVDDI